MLMESRETRRTVDTRAHVDVPLLESTHGVLTEPIVEAAEKRLSSFNETDLHLALYTLIELVNVLPEEVCSLAHKAARM